MHFVEIDSTVEEAFCRDVLRDAFCRDLQSSVEVAFCGEGSSKTLCRYFLGYSG